MKQMKMSIVSAMGMMLCAAGARAAFIGPLDFESGTQLNYASKPEGTRIIQLSNSTNPADPFNPPDNHSLLVEDAGPNTPHAGWWNHNQNDLPLTQGVFSGDFYLSPVDEEKTADPYMLLRFGNNPSSTINDTEKAFGLTANGASENITLAGVSLDNTWSMNAHHSVTLYFVFDSAAQTLTVSGTLNGHVLKAGDQTQFTINQPAVGSINAFQIDAGWTTNDNSRVIVDNLSLAVPEPASLSLLGLGGLGLLMRRRRSL